MDAQTVHQLDAHLDSVVNRIQDIRALNLSLETDLQRALEESQDMLGALALYRRLLGRAVDYTRWQPRRVA